MQGHDLLSHIPSWLAPVAVFFMVFFFFAAKLSEAYEGFAKIFPVFGKYWRKRGLEKEEQSQKEITAMAEKIVKMVSHHDAYDALAQEMEHVKQRLQYMETMELINQAYLIEDAKWHAYVDITLGEKDIALDFPQRFSYTEFVRKWRDEKWRPEIDRPI